MAMFANDHYLYEVLANQQGFGGYYFDDTDTKVIVDDPKMVEAVGVIKQLWESKGALQNPGGTDIYCDEMTVLLKSGKVISQLIGAGWYPSTLTQNMPELAGKWRLMRDPASRQGARSPATSTRRSWSSQRRARIRIWPGSSRSWP